MKPAQFSRPSIPAAAPAKQAERNFVVLSEELAITFGAYMSCAALFSDGVAIAGDVEQGRESDDEQWQRRGNCCAPSSIPNMP